MGCSCRRHLEAVHQAARDLVLQVLVLVAVREQRGVVTLLALDRCAPAQQVSETRSEKRELQHSKSWLLPRLKMPLAADSERRPAGDARSGAKRL